MTGWEQLCQEKTVLKKIVMIPGYSACLFVPTDKDFPLQQLLVATKNL